MTMIYKYDWRWVLAVLTAGVFSSHPAVGAPVDGAQLQAQRAQLQAELQVRPFERIRSMLGTGKSVCGMLFLHLNVRSFLSDQSPDGVVLHMAAGPK